MAAASQRWSMPSVLGWVCSTGWVIVQANGNHSFSGGNIDTLQRCDNITTFIKRDAEEARIEIELYNGSGDNYQVACNINIKGKVVWAINEERANKTQVEELVASLNIQTGNMCQFLPQDVVKNFPLMTPQERFLSTVGEGRLVEQFDILKDIQKIVDNRDNI